MKRILTLLTVLMLGLATFASALSYQQPTTKSGKLDKRYNANKHVKKDGTSDMRYKTSKKAAAKKKS
jgi:hypothetical protein